MRQLGDHSVVGGGGGGRDINMEVDREKKCVEGG
jgi:hypothetical protein